MSSSSEHAPSGILLTSYLCCLSFRTHFCGSLKMSLTSLSHVPKDSASIVLSATFLLMSHVAIHSLSVESLLLSTRRALRGDLCFGGFLVFVGVPTSPKKISSNIAVTDESAASFCPFVLSTVLAGFTKTDVQLTLLFLGTQGVDEVLGTSLVLAFLSTFLVLTLAAVLVLSFVMFPVLLSFGAVFLDSRLCFDLSILRHVSLPSFSVGLSPNTSSSKFSMLSVWVVSVFSSCPLWLSSILLLTPIVAVDGFADFVFLLSDVLILHGSSSLSGSPVSSLLEKSYPFLVGLLEPSCPVDKKLN